MKILALTIVCGCLLFGAIANVSAEDVFPEFTPSSATIYLPSGLINGYEPDPTHEAGLNVTYAFEQSQFFTDAAKRHIQTLAEGFSGKTDRSTPWKTLTELVAAYQTGNVDAVRSLFTPESQGELDAMLADPEITQKYLAWMQSIASVEVLLGFNYRDGFLAMIAVRSTAQASAAQVPPTPLFFSKRGESYLVSAATLDEPIDSNIALFLQQGHTVQDLLKPPLPEYTLTIEKTGTGSGLVDGGSGECGAECLQVYQQGMVVFLKAEPDDDAVFAGWLVDGQPLQGRLEMTKDLTVTAIFNKRPASE